MTLRRGPLVIGVAALAAAVVLTLRDGLTAGVPAALVVAVAVIAAGVLGVLDLLGRSTGGPTTESLNGSDDDVEVPGTAIDRRLERAASDAEARTELCDRVETVAVGVLVRETGCPRETARDRLADGEWTDDELARALFDDGPADSVGDSLRALVTGRTRFERALDRAVAELEERDR